MRIAFINSSLEPGRDGMGDYTLSLAAALRGLGHEVLGVGMSDRWIPRERGVETAANAAGVELERLSVEIPLAGRVARAAERLRAFRPDWVSFQMSCYAHNKKGLLFTLNRLLPPLVAACENWQVMFQELWIAFHHGARWKHRLVGALQRASIRRCIATLRPRLLQTSTPLFRAMLKTIGLDASVLPLAGSIPVDAEPGTDWFLELLGEAGRPLVADDRARHLAGGFFGAIYPGWEPEPFFSSLRKVAAKTGQRITILAAGRMGGAGEAIWGRLVTAYPDFHLQKLGELSVARVSHFLRNLDFGIAATPWLAIGKSSATAAMLDHGLPVMVTRNDSQPRARLEIEPPANPLLIQADRDVSEHFLAGLPRRAPRHSAGDLAAEFVRRLQQAESAPRYGR
jgi:hypothetical protein